MKERTQVVVAGRSSENCRNCHCRKLAMLLFNGGISPEQEKDDGGRKELGRRKWLQQSGVRRSRRNYYAVAGKNERRGNNSRKKDSSEICCSMTPLSPEEEIAGTAGERSIAAAP